MKKYIFLIGVCATAVFCFAANTQPVLVTDKKLIHQWQAALNKGTRAAVAGRRTATQSGTPVTQTAITQHTQSASSMEKQRDSQ